MGKFTDRFMNAFGNKDDDYDDFDEEFYDDDMVDEDDLDEPAEKSGGLFRRKTSSASDTESRDSREYREPRETREPTQKSSLSSVNPFSRASKAPRPVSNSRMGGGNEVCIFKPSSIEDSREITETLLQGKAVVINFEGLHVEISQRIIDFISGSCYALDGNLQKISNYIFIATPNSVDISGDFQDLFSSDDGSFDIAGFKSPLI